MAETIDDGGPAFPVGPGGDTWTSPDGLTSHQFPGAPGMTLRDYFAAHAPEQISTDADPRFIQERTGLTPPTDKTNGPHWSEFWMRGEAIMRYQYADAMLAARHPEQP